jgi:hypothetical protein
VRLLLDRFDRNDPLQRTDRRAELATYLVEIGQLGEQRQMEAPELLAPPDRPVLEAVLGQQLPGIQPECCLVG